MGPMLPSYLEANSVLPFPKGDAYSVFCVVLDY